MGADYDAKLELVETKTLQLLGLDQVGFSYRSGSEPVDVISNLTLSVHAGQMLCLAGRSGSGKTTALMLAAVLLRPTSGSVWWGETDTTTLTEEEAARQRRPGLGIVFQGGALIDSLRAVENVGLPGRAGKDGGGPERAYGLLEQLGIKTRAKHFPSELSAGEQQRVALARALFADPPLLLIDEPTANLDRNAARSLIELLSELGRQGRGILTASHDENLIAAADHVVRLW